MLRNGATTTMTYAVTPTINLIKTLQQGAAALTAVSTLAATATIPAGQVCQEAYQFTADVGTEQTAALLAPQDTAPTVDLAAGDANIRLRTLMQEMVFGRVPTTDDWQLQWTKGEGGTLADSYPATNWDSVSVAQNWWAGQSFLGDGKILTRVGFYIAKTAGSTGTVTAQLWTHTGTFGSGGKGASLLQSSTTPVDVASLSITHSWVYFDFPETFTLAAGTPYVIGLSGPTTLPVNMAIDNTSPTHPGNGVHQTNFPQWVADTWDAIFEVYTRTDQWADVRPDPYLVATYATSNSDNGVFLGDATISRQAQSFMGAGQKLKRIGVQLSKDGTPTATGNITCHLYAHTGTFNSGSSAPTGTALTSSSTIIVATSLPDGLAARQMYYFDFDETFTMVDGTPYFLVVQASGFGNASNRAAVGADTSSPGGNGVKSQFASAAWGTNTAIDLVYEVYGPSGSTVLANGSAPVTDGAPLIASRMTGGTGAFATGAVSKDGLIDNVGWFGGDYTEFLYTLTLDADALADADTIRFRVLRNGTPIISEAPPTLTVSKLAAPTQQATAALTATSTLTADATVIPYVPGEFTDPSSLLGLASWYDADDASTFTYSSSVLASEWRDKSGLGRHLAQSDVNLQPQRSGSQNGRATLTFGGDDHMDTGPFTVNQPFTLFMALDDLAVDYEGWWGSVGGKIQIYTGNANLLYMYADTANAQGLGITQVHSGPHQWAFEFNGTTSAAYKDGSLQVAGDAGPAGTTTGWRTAERDLYLAYRLRGELFEVVAYDRVLTTTERQQVEDYLNTKWFVAGGPPTQQASAALTATSTLVATAEHQVPASAALTASSTLTTVGVRAPAGAAALVAASTLTATAVRSPIAAAGLTAASTLTATGVRTALGSVALTAASTLTTAALREVVAAVPLTAVSTLTATGTGVGVQLASVNLTATSTLSAAGIRVPQAAASLVATSTLAATADRVRPGTAALTAASTLTATAVVPIKVATLVEDFSTPLDAGKWYLMGDPLPVAVDGRLNLTSQASAGSNRLVSFNLYDLTESTLSVEFAQTPTPGTTTQMWVGFYPDLGIGADFFLDVSASTLWLEENAATSIPFSPVDHRFLRFRMTGGTLFWETSPDNATWTVRRSVTAAGSMTSARVELGVYTGSGPNATGLFDNLNTGVRLATAAADLTATSTLTATAVGIGIIPAAAGLSAVSTLTATAVRVPQAAASLVAASTLTVSAVRQPVAATALTATSLLTAAGVREQQAATTLAAGSTLSTTGLRAPQAAAALAATSTLAATAVREQPGSATLTGISTLSTAGVRAPQAAASLTATSTLSATALRTAEGGAALTATSTLAATAVGIGIIPGSAVLVAASTLSATAARTAQLVAALSATSTLSTTGVREPQAAAAMTATSTMTATATPGRGHRRTECHLYTDTHRSRDRHHHGRRRAERHLHIDRVWCPAPPGRCVADRDVHPGRRQRSGSCSVPCR